MPLPDCMMPDGAEPCKGYQELRAALELAWKTMSVWLAHGYGQQEQYTKMQHARDEARRALSQ